MITKINFMRDEDINIVNENVDKLIEKAHNREIELIEPTFDEFKKVRDIILDYIKKNNRIVYGGYAWNNLIKKISPSDVFYKETDYTDFEFYSNKPIEDMKNICDILYKKGFQFIQGKNAQHFDTYTIFVNFIGYCDISYMPSNIYHNVITEKIDGIRVIHPKFILVDILRQFTDPITSFWRLDKNIKRGKLMIKNYPLNLSSKKISINELKKDSKDIVNYIISNLNNYKTLIFMGSIALNTYLNPNTDITKQTTFYDNTLLELVSVNLNDDVKFIYNLIIKYFLDMKKVNDVDNNIIIEQYYPFFQFTDYKVIFKYKGETIISIYGNNEKCIPCNKVKLKDRYNINIGTFNYLFMFNLIKFHQAYIEKDKANQDLYDYNMYMLLTSRDKFLNDNNKNVLDNTIFEDFKIDCIGTPISPKRKFMLSRRDKNLLPKSAIRPYDPDENKDYDMSMYNFNNYSGNIVNNPKDLIINKKN